MVVFVVMIGVGGLLVGLIAWAAVQDAAKVKTNLMALAGRLGLQVVETKRSFGVDRAVHGRHQGREIKFWTYVTGAGKSRTHWAAVGVRPRTSGLSFEFRRQGVVTKLIEFFGGKEITVGDPEFDRVWFVQTNQPEFLAAALVPSIRQKFMALPARVRDGSVKLTDGWVQFAEQGSFSNAEVIARLEAKLPLLHDLADVAEVAGDGRV